MAALGANDVKAALVRSLAYSEAQNWAGHDPYDALNSRMFGGHSERFPRVVRLVLTQALKHLPVNFRPLLGIPKTQNPKALGLFLSSFVKLSRNGLFDTGPWISSTLARIIGLRAPGTPYFCWGYSFDWQTRTKVVPRGTANLVCTCFVANALLDLFESQLNEQCLVMALSAAQYIVDELYWSDSLSSAGFAYPLPTTRGQIHNANFLAAALLCRIYKHTGETQWLCPALHVARCSAARQRCDGSWPYGEAPAQNWIDNFHSGYNLCALRSLSADASTAEFEVAIRRGFRFYRDHFFRRGVAAYFHDRTYPVDVHSVAQSILTLLAFNDLDTGNIPLAVELFRWTMKHLWSEQGYFYYRMRPLITNRIPYMRWSQAWMVLALSALLAELSTIPDPNARPVSELLPPIIR
jgi:hypothetical protein